MTPSRGTLVAALKALVEVETPSGDLAALEEGFTLLRRSVGELTGREATVDVAGGVPDLLVRATASPHVLMVGHLDTVWPLGTLAGMPFEVRGDTATGPGVFDMKGGLVIALGAMAACARSEHISLLVTGDEELGSPAGRPLIERHAREAQAVLVLEPSGPGGRIKRARKGVGIYEFTIAGREAHAGLEPERGVNATVELAALVADLVDLQDPAAGTTVTPTKAVSGTTTNTVPGAATLHADVRAWSVEELVRVDRAVRDREPRVSGVEVVIAGGINRPPMEEAVTADVVRVASEVALDLGWEPLESMAVGGGSDGNFTAALGVPTLDGVGALGGGAHARDEWVDLASLEPRAVWLARVIERVVGEGALGREA